MTILTVKEVKEIILDFCDRWAVEEKPRSLYGAVFGVLFFTSVIIYAVYLAVILVRAPPVQTSLFESTGKHVYNITIACVDLWAVARDETADYSYDLSGSGDSSSSDTSANSDTSNTDCTQPKTCFLNQNSDLNCGIIDDPYADCVNCGACTICLDDYAAGSTCDNMTWIEGSKKKRDSSGQGFEADTDTCLVVYKFPRGSPCYTKEKGNSETTVELQLNESKNFSICAPKPGRDHFSLFVSESTKIFIVGTDSDYEIYGYPSETDTYLLNRLRSDDRTIKKKTDTWYGIPINTQDTDTSEIAIQLSPIFDVIVLAPAFNWIGWAGQVGGMAGAFGSIWGLALAIFLWVMGKVKPNKVAPDSTSDQEMY